MAVNKGFYFTGKPCRRGHIAKRRIGSSICLECEKVNRVNYRATDKYKKYRYDSYVKKSETRYAAIMYDRARGRAARKGVPFTITVQDVEELWTPGMKCPVFGIVLRPNVGGTYQAPDSPSLDRLIPSTGYVKGNIAIISTRANKMKADCASPEEIRMVADWLESQLNR